MTNEEFNKIIPTLNEIYVIMSKATRCPYVECDSETFDDEIFVFTSKEAAEDKTHALVARDIETTVMTVDKKNSLGFYTDLFAFGVNAIRYTDVSGEYVMELDKVIKRNIPDNVKIYENPSLQLSLLYFVQESRKDNSDREKIKKMDEEVAANIRRSKFLVPYIKDTRDGKTLFRFPMLNISETELMLPIFADTMTMSRFIGKKQMAANLMGIEELINMQLSDKVKGFVLNPNGVGIPLNKKSLEKILNDYD